MYGRTLTLAYMLFKPWRKADTSAGILEQSMGARNLVGIGMSYRSGSLCSLVESIHRNRFLGSLKVQKYHLSTIFFSYGRMQSLVYKLCWPGQRFIFVAYTFSLRFRAMQRILPKLFVPHYRYQAKNNTVSSFRRAVSLFLVYVKNIQG
jgi:hypothetical protein